MWNVVRDWMWQDGDGERGGRGGENEREVESAGDAGQILDICSEACLLQ